MNETARQHRQLTISVEGAALSADIARTTTSVVVRASLGVPAAAELEFAEMPSDTSPPFAVGARIALDVDRTSLFEGAIAAIEYAHGGDGARTTRIRAYDAMEALRQRCRIRRIDNASAASLAAELAGEIGLGSAASGGDTVLVAALQRGESDLEFLVELAARDGLYPVVDGDALRLVGADGAGDEIALTLGRDLLEARLTESVERSVASVDVEAWNPATLQAHKASSERQAGEGAASQVIANRIVNDPGESRGVGDSAIDRGEGFARVAEGVSRGNPDLVPGRPITLTGVASPMVGRYVVATATHRFEATGYRTEFSTRPPTRPTVRSEAVTTLGRVTSIADPERRGRCKVGLPGFADVEAGWLQCVVPGAGRRKGAAILPEVDEDVLVVFPSGDLAHGFVLGGLYGTQSLPPGMQDKADRSFVLRTGNGQSLELSGSASMARLSTRSGSLLEFAGNRARLATTTDLVIEAPGKRIVIRAAAIDFEKG